MTALGGPKGELQLQVPEESQSLTRRQKVSLAGATLLSIAAASKGIEASFHQPHYVDNGWLLTGLVGITTIAAYVRQSRVQPEQAVE